MSGYVAETDRSVQLSATIAACTAGTVKTSGEAARRMRNRRVSLLLPPSPQKLTLAFARTVSPGTQAKTVAATSVFRKASRKFATRERL